MREGKPKMFRHRRRTKLFPPEAKRTFQQRTAVFCSLTDSTCLLGKRQTGQRMDCLRKKPVPMRKMKGLLFLLKGILPAAVMRMWSGLLMRPGS